MYVFDREVHVSSSYSVLRRFTDSYTHFFSGNEYLLGTFFVTLAQREITVTQLPLFTSSGCNPDRSGSIIDSGRLWLMVMAVFDQSYLFSGYKYILCQDNEFSCLDDTCFVIISFFFFFLL